MREEAMKRDKALERYLREAFPEPPSAEISDEVLLRQMQAGDFARDIYARRTRRLFQIEAATDAWRAAKARPAGRGDKGSGPG